MVAPGEVLFDESVIGRRVREIGASISAEYLGRIPLIIGVLDGSAIFLADLVRAIEIPAEIDVLSVTKFSDDRGIRIVKDVSVPLEGRDVIVVEASTQTGRTLNYIMETFAARKPASLASCVLVGREPNPGIDAITYTAFHADAAQLVGYGLDSQGRYREMPGLFLARETA